MTAPNPRRHVPPPPGTPQPLHGPRLVARGSSGDFLGVGARLFAPLEGLVPNDVLQGGYGWLSLTDGGATYHPGLDLNSSGGCNADDGLPVVAMLAGVVRFTHVWDGTSMGEGSHLWYEVNDPCSPGPTFIHHDHLGRIDVTVGQRVMPGDPLGTCSASGGWDCAHLHTEWSQGPPVQGYWQWPYGWSKPQVIDAYWNPADWWGLATARVAAEGADVVAMQLMEDWQLKQWVLGPLYEWAGIPYNPDSGTAQGWVTALRRDHYLGRPRTEERPYGTGEEAGVWIEFEGGVLLYRLRDGAASWTG